MTIRPRNGWHDLPARRAVCSANLLASPGRAVAHPGDIAWWAAGPEDRMTDMYRSLGFRPDRVLRSYARP